MRSLFVAELGGLTICERLDKW